MCSQPCWLLVTTWLQAAVPAVSAWPGVGLEFAGSVLSVHPVPLGASWGLCGQHQHYSLQILLQQRVVQGLRICCAGADNGKQGEGVA